MLVVLDVCQMAVLYENLENGPAVAASVIAPVVTDTTLQTPVLSHTANRTHEPYHVIRLLTA